MTTFNQLTGIYRKKGACERKKKRERCMRPFLKGNPQVKARCVRILIKTPRKPNSGLRKVAKIQRGGMKRKSRVFAYLPGKGHNLQAHSTVLVRGGRVKDVRGMKYHLVRGVYDFKGTRNRKKSRSRYGVKKNLKFEGI
jgi:small subunit ribosomal protein S12